MAKGLKHKGFSCFSKLYAMSTWPKISNTRVFFLLLLPFSPFIRWTLLFFIGLSVSLFPSPLDWPFNINIQSVFHRHLTLMDYLLLFHLALSVEWYLQYTWPVPSATTVVKLINVNWMWIIISPLPPPPPPTPTTPWMDVHKTQGLFLRQKTIIFSLLRPQVQDVDLIFIG